MLIWLGSLAAYKSLQTQHRTSGQTRCCFRYVMASQDLPCSFFLASMENPRLTLRASPAKNECSLQVFKEGLEDEWGTRGEMISGYSFYWDSVYLYCRPTEDKELNEKYSFPMGNYLWFNASEWVFFRTMVWPDLCAAKDPSTVLWFGYNEEISYRADKRDGALIVKYSERSPEAHTEKISYPKDNDDWFKHDPACFKTYDADMEKTETMFSKIDKIDKMTAIKKR